MDHHPERQRVAAEAATWYARLHSDHASPADRRAFNRWLTADEAHAQAWARQTFVSRALDGGRDDPAILAMIADARRPAPAPAATRWWPMAAAATVILTVTGTTGMWLKAPSAPLATPADEQRYATQIGEARDITLPDGTLMTLDAASVVRIRRPGPTRQVSVERGQAFFKVAHDPVHPFIVSAGGNSVTALGTQFAVRRIGEHVTVSLTAGSVRVDAPRPGRKMVLTPGNSLTIGPELQFSRTGASTATAWRKGEITFEAAPLGEVVAELNRYSRQQIRLSSPKLAQHTFSGVLRTDGGARALVDALSAYGVAHARIIDKEHLDLIPNEAASPLS